MVVCVGPDVDRVAPRGVPFDRFRTRDARTDGMLESKNTKGIVFLIDLGLAKPGTEGVISIDDVGVY